MRHHARREHEGADLEECPPVERRPTRRARDPAGNGIAIAPVGLAELALERPLLVRDNEDLEAHGHRQEVREQRNLPVEQHFPREDREDPHVHRVPAVPVGTSLHQPGRRFDRRRRASAQDCEIVRAP